MQATCGELNNTQRTEAVGKGNRQCAYVGQVHQHKHQTTTATLRTH